MKAVAKRARKTPAVTRITKLTPEQEARIPEWRDKWIAAGLRTGATPWADFERGVRACYTAAGLEQPRIIIKAASPMALVQADTALGRILRSVAQVVAQVRAQVRAQVDAQVRDQVGAQVHDLVDAQVHDQVDAQVHDQVRDQVDAQVHAQVRAQVDAQVGAQVRAQVRDQVVAQVRAQVRDQVGAQVHDQVDAQVRDQVGAQVHDQVDADLVSPVERDRWYNIFGGQFWVGGYYWGSPSFVSFFREVCGLKLPAKVAAAADAYQLASESGCWWMPCRGYAVLCARPTEIHRDAEHRLHCETGPAIVWADGWGVYAWHGTRVPAEWITNKAALDPKTALTHPNIEQRRAAAEIVGWGRILEHAKAKVVDTDDPEIGTLYRADLPDAPGSQFLEVRCGTGRKFVLPVPGDLTTALAANSWTYDVPQVDLQQIEVRT